METVDRFPVGLGLIGPLVGFAATFAAAARSPTFGWTQSALSDLGAPTAANPWLFNWGLVASAVVTLPFAWVLWQVADHPAERLATATFAACIVALGLVGVFPSGTALHLPVAVGYFSLLSFTLWIHGTGAALAGAVRLGLVAMWLGIAHVLLWIVWVAAGLGGVAVPEIVGSILLYVWIVLVARRIQL